jgi:hypothetical protein
MRPFRYLALLLLLALPATHAVQAQSSAQSSSLPSDSTASQPDQSQQPAASDQGQISVQARIKARREQRRATAIHAAYAHRYEAYVGGGYLRFKPGPTLQRVNEKSWNVGFTRYYDERLGVAIDASGLYARAFVPPQLGNNGVTKPAIHQYVALIGPTYRFYVQPKYSVSARVQAGLAHGNFSGDTGGDTTLSTNLGLYKDAYTFAVGANVAGEYNLTSNLGVRVAPSYLLTGFGSSKQNSLGFSIGAVYRFGKQ